MHHRTMCLLPALAAFALSINSAHAAVSTWEVSFWQGPQCNGENVGIQSGPETPQLSQPCNAIEGIGLTSALDYRVANSDYKYILGLHKTNDCSDAGGTYQGSADQPICVPTNGYRAYSVRTLAAVSKKRRTLSERRESNKVIAARSPTAYGGLSKRANDCYTPAFALGAFGLSATFYYYAAGVCSASAKEEDVNKAQCGIAATVGTVSFLLTGYSLQGIYRTSKRSLLDDLDVDLPFEDITIFPGHTVSMTKHSVEADEELGGDWIHYATDLVRHSNNAQHSGFISFHPSGHRRVSLQVDDEGLSEGINKRAPNGATAYYGWVDGDTEAFFNTDGGACTDDNTIDRLGLQLWNFGHDSNEAQFCASLIRNKTGRQLNSGNFFLGNGIFDDKSQQCKGDRV